MTRIAIGLAIAIGVGVSAQQPDEVKSLRGDMFAVLTGDVPRFERGMRTLEALLLKAPTDPQLRVLHGTGVFARAGQAFQQGDTAGGMRLFQASLDEMAEAVKTAPDDLLVRGRRGVVLIAASRAMPAAMASSLTRLAVDDFERVLDIRERNQTFARGSLHQRGELLTGLGDGANRLGDHARARTYFERIAGEMPDTIYGTRAAAWLAGKPETMSAEYFGCSGCHVE
jgi:hypothetical protein